MSWTRRLMLVGGVLVVAAVAGQAIPYGHGLTNPPVVQEPPWDSAETRALAQRACFDCHSNRTAWPLYARLAPVSWLVAHDVEEGRALLNFSEWQRPQEEAADAAEEIEEGKMPLRIYTLMHPRARLTATERDRLAAGLKRTLAGAER